MYPYELFSRFIERQKKPPYRFYIKTKTVQRIDIEILFFEIVTCSPKTRQLRVRVKPKKVIYF